MQFGIVTIPVWGQVFVAEREHGAWLNGERLSVSRVDTCAKALVETGFPYTVREDMPFILHDLKMLLNHRVGVRRGGSALDLCRVAAGRFDGYFECGLKPWDVAAGWLLVEEAGGRVSSRDGSPSTYSTGPFWPPTAVFTKKCNAFSSRGAWTEECHQSPAPNRRRVLPNIHPERAAHMSSGVRSSG